MEGQKCLKFHKKYLHLCFKDEQQSYGLERHEVTILYYYRIIQVDYLTKTKKVETLLVH